jgi:hypothetical protein
MFRDVIQCTYRRMLQVEQLKSEIQDIHRGSRQKKPDKVHRRINSIDMRCRRDSHNGETACQYWGTASESMALPLPNAATLQYRSILVL